ncbi:hypothetical protein OG909_12205 [Streptomyces sp. NBC_01754]|uniref:hypothetical protein n=1 Tax=Streptomyces sp. NBC_01754 TaxID=2975930 RepID=UPI002DDAD85A|nr:hypothetical protein [Streptomyces sp. NBC_01754]WSC92997.1 hypothetical protein OG909_12205 [Streptomyces sp. NBC_01754]
MKTARPFRHPLATHPAGHVLGHRADGRPIYAIAGGDGTGEGGTGGDGGQGGTGGDTGQQGGTEGQQQGTGGQAPADQQQGTEGDESSLPAWAQAALKTARAEAGKSRVTAKQKAADDARASLAQDIGKALGLVEDDAPADPAQLTQQLAAEQAKARGVAVELAAYKAAQTEQVRADRLLNSRTFTDRLAALDPAADDFGDQLKAAIKAEVTTDPDLYKTRPAGAVKGGADFSGTGPAPKKPANLHDAIAARLSG